MRIEFDYTAEETAYRGIAVQADCSWGKGVRITIFDAGGGVRDRMNFVCHPEFDGFDDWQAKAPAELVALAIERLNSGIHEAALAKCRPHGIALVVRFHGNDPAT